MKPTDFSETITNFLSIYLPNQRGSSPNTIKVYRDSYLLLLKFIEEKSKIKLEKLKINDITKDIVVEFLDYLEVDRSCSASTRNLRLAAIKAFYKYLQYQNIENLHEIQKILSIKKKSKRI